MGTACDGWCPKAAHSIPPPPLLSQQFIFSFLHNQRLLCLLLFHFLKCLVIKIIPVYNLSAFFSLLLLREQHQKLQSLALFCCLHVVRHASAFLIETALIIHECAVLSLRLFLQTHTPVCLRAYAVQTKEMLFANFVRAVALALIREIICCALRIFLLSRVQQKAESVNVFVDISYRHNKVTKIRFGFLCKRISSFYFKL